MSHETRWPRRHPLCTCPELTFANLSTFDRMQCAGGTIAHPVLTAEQCQELLGAFIVQHAAEAAP